MDKYIDEILRYQDIIRDLAEENYDYFSTNEYECIKEFKHRRAIIGKL